MKIKRNIIISIILLWFGFAQFSWAEISLTELYGVRDISLLEELIEKESSAADTPEKKKRLAIAWHNLAIEEQSGAAEKAFAILKPLKKELPKDYEVLGYLGSALTMVGRDSWNPLTKMSNVNKGIAKIDKAIIKDKDNIICRLIRIYTSFSLPSFFGREEKIKPDLDYILDLTLRTETTKETQSEINYLMGLLLVKEDKEKEAKVFLAKSIQFDPGSLWAKKSEKILDD
ncbi:MAG: hypothetical protein KAH20_03905 [Methylococcales bacterium]|nr:hypothetical protein [Methylococcales bacterium]